MDLNPLEIVLVFVAGIVGSFLIALMVWIWERGMRSFVNPIPADERGAYEQDRALVASLRPVDRTRLRRLIRSGRVIPDPDEAVRAGALCRVESARLRGLENEDRHSIGYAFVSVLTLGVAALIQRNAWLFALIPLWLACVFVVLPRWVRKHQQRLRATAEVNGWSLKQPRA